VSVRGITALLVLLACGEIGSAQAQKEPPQRRYGVVVDLDKFPQASPKDTLASLVKAIDENRIDYVLAQLADPEFVDRRVQDYGGRFEEVVREAKGKLVDNPATRNRLKRYSRTGEWQEGESDASVGVKDGTDRIFFRKIDNRWYMENRKKGESK
jgi:hypothetical protein